MNPQGWLCLPQGGNHTADIKANSRGTIPDNFTTFVSGIPGPGHEPVESHDTNCSGIPLPKGIIRDECPGNFIFRTVERDSGTSNLAGS